MVLVGTTEETAERLSFFVWSSVDSGSCEGSLYRQTKFALAPVSVQKIAGYPKIRPIFRVTVQKVDRYCGIDTLLTIQQSCSFRVG